MAKTFLTDVCHSLPLQKCDYFGNCRRKKFLLIFTVDGAIKNMTFSFKRIAAFPEIVFKLSSGGEETSKFFVR